MALVISSIGDKKDLANERIGFNVKSDCNLKYFLIFQTTHTDKGFYNRSNNSFWLSPQDVKAGDRVVVYTKKGDDSFQHNDDGSTTYFRYWGLSDTIFPAEQYGIVLAETRDWSLSRDM